MTKRHKSISKISTVLWGGLVPFKTVHSTPQSFATEYRISVSLDGANWHTVAEKRGCTGGREYHEFAPTKARYVRVQSLKPDAAGQEGNRMAVAELEAYE